MLLKKKKKKKKNSNAALGFARLTLSKNLHTEIFNETRANAIQKMIKSICSQPQMVSGNNNFCTEMLRFFNGKVIGKIGASGVYLSGIVDKGFFFFF
jgi:L-asparaginase II